MPSMPMTTSPSESEIKAAMARTNELFNTEVFAKGNFEALDQIYTTDARILPPGAPMISGRAAIKDFWSGMVQSAHATAAVLVSDDVLFAGNNAVEIGHATLNVHPPGQSAMQMEVKYVVYWREEDSLWKWHIDIWNGNS
jgi:ketosteroid isomerase-like protein